MGRASYNGGGTLLKFGSQGMPKSKKKVSREELEEATTAKIGGRSALKRARQNLRGKKEGVLFACDEDIQKFKSHVRQSSTSITPKTAPMKGPKAPPGRSPSGRSRTTK